MENLAIGFRKSAINFRNPTTGFRNRALDFINPTTGFINPVPDFRKLTIGFSKSAPQFYAATERREGRGNAEFPINQLICWTGHSFLLLSHLLIVGPGLACAEGMASLLLSKLSPCRNRLPSKFRKR